MADTIRIVNYYYIVGADKPGEGARILKHLDNAGVELAALHAFPSARKTQVVFVPVSDVAFKAAAKAAKWKVIGPKKAFVVDGEDRTGALVDHFAALGAANVNVTAVDAVQGGAGRFGAILWVKARDAKRAAKALGVA